MLVYILSKIQNLFCRLMGDVITRAFIILPVGWLSEFVWNVLEIYAGKPDVPALDMIFGPIIVTLCPWQGGGSIIYNKNQFYMVIFLAIVIIECTYCCIFRRSIGQQLLGLRIYSINGDKPNILQIIIRTVVKYSYLAFAPYLVVIPIFTPNNRGIHDYLSGTYVARKDQTLYDLRMRR